MRRRLAIRSSRFSSSLRSPKRGCSASIMTRDRKSTRLNSSHLVISYAVFCLKKKKTQLNHYLIVDPPVLEPRSPEPQTPLQHRPLDPIAHRLNSHHLQYADQSGLN